MESQEIIDRGGSKAAHDLLAALEPEQLTTAKREHFPRRYLNVSQLLVLWSLRLYLLFMIVVVIYQLFTGAE